MIFEELSENCTAGVLKGKVMLLSMEILGGLKLLDHLM